MAGDFNYVCSVTVSKILNGLRTSKNRNLKLNHTNTKRKSCYLYFKNTSNTDKFKKQFTLIQKYSCVLQNHCILNVSILITF